MSLFSPTEHITQVRLSFSGGPKDGTVEDGTLSGQFLPETFNVLVNTEEGTVHYVYHLTRCEMPKGAVPTIHYRYID